MVDAENGQPVDTEEDDEEEEEGSVCGRCSFPWLVCVSLVQLGIYLNKLYQDGAAVALYYAAKQGGYCAASALCLLAPAALYLLYELASALKASPATPSAAELGTRVVHALLLVPWQIKGRVELLHFSAQRVCLGRGPTVREAREKARLGHRAALLEFFEEFYAGLGQLLLQATILVAALDRPRDGASALPGELVASSLTLFSVLLAVRRGDDGPLTAVLSTLAWALLLASRTACLAMGAAAVGAWALVAFCLAHALVVTAWVASIALSGTSKPPRAPLFLLSFVVFGLPSLVYWPLMFQLKERRRPLLFLLLLWLENGALLGAWAALRPGPPRYALPSLVALGTALGTALLLLYRCCKPESTDRVVLADRARRRDDDVRDFGMYFEFCEQVFELESTPEFEAKLKKVRERTET